MSTQARMPGPVRDMVGYNGKPPKVAWPHGARVAVSLVVNYEEGSERAVGDGDPVGERSMYAGMSSHHRDLAVESMYEYGSRVGFWRLLDIFEELDVKATFYACAVALERNRDAAKEIRPRGHDVVSHGWRWEDVSLLSREEEAEHIAMAVASIAETTGERPTGWYCRYGPSVNTRELLVEEGGFRYDCDAYNDDLPYWTEVMGRRHLVIPYSLNTNDGKFNNLGFGSPRDLEEHLMQSLDRLYKEGATYPKMMSVGLHMRNAGLPARAQAVYNFISYAQSLPGVWFATRAEVADHWYEHHA